MRLITEISVDFSLIYIHLSVAIFHERAKEINSMLSRAVNIIKKKKLIIARTSIKSGEGELTREGSQI